MKKLTSTKNQRRDNPKVQYKLKIYNNPTSKNMLHEEENDDDNYESIDETAV